MNTRHAFPADLMRAQRAIARGARALGRRPRAVVESSWSLDDPSHEVRRHEELERRTIADVVEHGRELVARGLELERQADEAKRAGVEALRYAWSGRYSWAAIGELLGVSGQAAHKRYRDVEAAEAQTTIDDLEP